MRKRTLVALAVLAVLLAGGYVAFDWVNSGPGITRANYELVHDGMTLSEVERLFGAPPTLSMMTSACWLKAWEGSGFVALVSFDNENKVIGKTGQSVWFIERLFRRFRV